MTILKYMLDEEGIPPKYAHMNDAGMDLCTPNAFCIKSGERVVIDTKIHFFIDPGFYLAIVPKSGLAAKFGITLVNTPGTIDADYTDTIKVILLNTGKEVKHFEKGNMICQAILKKKKEVELVQVYEKPVTERQDGGLGSTGN